MEGKVLTTVGQTLKLMIDFKVVSVARTLPSVSRLVKNGFDIEFKTGCGYISKGQARVEFFQFGDMFGLPIFIMDGKKQQWHNKAKYVCSRWGQ